MRFSPVYRGLDSRCVSMFRARVCTGGGVVRRGWMEG